MDSKHVFCVITAAKCPHCKTFRKDWDDIRRTIEATGLVRIVDIELNSTNEVPNPEKYPKDLARYVKWFPTFLLFTGKSWNAAFPGLTLFDGQHSVENPDAKLEGVVFNGVLENGVPRYVHLKAPTKENLLNWIQHEVKAGSLSGQSQSPILSLLSNSSPTNVDQSTKSGTKFVALGSSLAPQNTGTFFVPTSASPICKMKYRPKNHGF